MEPKKLSKGKEERRSSSETSQEAIMPQKQVAETPQDMEVQEGEIGEFKAPPSPKLPQDEAKGDESQANEEDKQAERWTIPKMSGSSRKKFQWLIKNGYSVEEACIKYRDPIGVHPSRTKGTVEKRPREEMDKEGSLNLGRKRTKLSTSQRTEGSGRGKAANLAPPPRSYRNALEGVRIGILPVDYPGCRISEEQYIALESCIVDRSIEEESFGPQFISNSHREGWVILNCRNRETADWVLRITNDLIPWEGAQLKAVEERDFPKRKTLVAFLPNARDKSNEDIIKCLKSANRTLEVETWTLHRRVEQPKVTQVSFRVDNASAEQLMGEEAMLFFRLSRVNFHIVGDKPAESIPEAAREGKDSGEIDSSGMIQKEEVPGPSGLATSTPAAGRAKGQRKERRKGISPLKLSKEELQS